MSRIVQLTVIMLVTAVASAQAPVLRKGVSVQMPITTNAVPMPNADSADSVIVALTFRGIVYLEVTKVTPAQLSEQVKEEIGLHPGKSVYVKADERAPYLSVAEVLSALRKAGVNELSLLTSQHQPIKTSYVTPTGLEVLIPPPAPDAAHSVTLIIGNGQVSDAELKQHVQQHRSVVLQGGEKATFSDVIHAVDLCRAAGTKVYLAAPGN
jgi:biopolymer transport protein TolR